MTHGKVLEGKKLKKQIKGSFWVIFVYSIGPSSIKNNKNNIILLSPYYMSDTFSSKIYMCVCVNSSNPHNTSVKKAPFFFPFHIFGN